MEGSAIRRIGFDCWQRNVVIALGNGERDPHIVDILRQRYDQCSSLVQQHIDWAIEQLTGRNQ